MKTSLVTLVCAAVATFSALAQNPTPPTPPAPPTAPPSATPSFTPAYTPAAPAVATATPAVATATPFATATVNPTASPANSFTLTLSSSSSPSPDDAIDSMIEKKVRSHFSSSTSHHHSSDNDDDAAWIALPIVIVVFFAIFGMPVLIVAVILYFSFSKNRAMHKTVRLMVEKGQPVPEALLNPPPVVRQRSDLRRAIKWMLWGVGFMIFFGACSGWDDGAWSIGIIPFMVGIGYLIFWRLDLREPAAVQPVTVVPPPTQAPPPPPSSPTV